tara:strand:+ start:540 stop:680 length:141 start_codon:yes stop_codon:yes gene_type:complete
VPPHKTIRFQKRNWKAFLHLKRMEVQLEAQLSNASKLVKGESALQA